MKLGELNLRTLIVVKGRHLLGLLPERFNPFIGHGYTKEKTAAKNFDSWNSSQKQQFIFQNIKKSTEYAYANIPFYKEFYSTNCFKPSDLVSFEDIRKIPLINKNILLENPVENRCLQVKGAVKVNTGGSTGHTLSFYQDRKAKKNHEDIHMEIIWEKIGYRNSDLKLVMIGQNTIKNGLAYSLRNNSILLDTYMDFNLIAPKLKKIAKTTPIRYLHGYPSILYEFALFCKESDPELRDLMRKELRGAFLGSEYPHPAFRETIEGVFEIETVNWYGHTEGAVLAYEKKEKYRYYPFHTYGFAEVSDEGHLVASSFYDKASPFIRYDTEDCINDTETENGLLISFGIKEGRNGEYITDRNNKKISLTGLIFGRHHKLFDFCTHIQVFQNEAGKAVILYLPKNNNNDLNPDLMFDSSNIKIDFSFKRIRRPIKTNSGKLNLLVKSNQLEL